MAALTDDGRVRETLCDGFTVTTEHAASGWTLTATDDDDEMLAQYTVADEVDAAMLYDNLIHADLSDLR